MEGMHLLILEINQDGSIDVGQSALASVGKQTAPYNVK